MASRVECDYIARFGSDKREVVMLCARNFFYEPLTYYLKDGEDEADYLPTHSRWSQPEVVIPSAAATNGAMLTKDQVACVCPFYDKALGCKKAIELKKNRENWDYKKWFENKRKTERLNAVGTKFSNAYSAVIREPKNTIEESIDEYLRLLGNDIIEMNEATLDYEVEKICLAHRFAKAGYDLKTLNPATVEKSLDDLEREMQSSFGGLSSAVEDIEPQSGPQSKKDTQVSELEDVLAQLAAAGVSFEDIQALAGGNKPEPTENDNEPFHPEDQRMLDDAALPRADKVARDELPPEILSFDPFEDEKKEEKKNDLEEAFADLGNLFNL